MAKERVSFEEGHPRLVVRADQKATEIARLAGQNEERAAQVGELTAENARLVALADQRATEIARLTGQIFAQADQKATEIARLTDQIEERKAQVGELKIDNVRLIAQADRRMTENAQLLAQADQREAEIAQLVTKVRLTKAQNARLAGQVEGLAAENTRLVAQIDARKSEHARFVAQAEEMAAENTLVLAHSRRRGILYLGQMKSMKIQLEQISQQLESALARVEETEETNKRLVAEADERAIENALVVARVRQKKLFYLHQLKEVNAQLEQAVVLNEQSVKISADSAIVRSIASALLRHTAAGSGKKFVRQLAMITGLFDAEYYLARYPDVKAAKVDALKHFVSYGCVENRCPGPNFNAPAYLKDNPDVREAKLPAFMHYLEHGLSEGRLVKGD